MATDKAPETIKVENSGEHKYKDVKNLVVCLKGLYYMKHDDSLIRVKNKIGKMRYFRKTSPLIVETSPGVYAHKTNAILTEDGIWFLKGDETIIQFENGKWYRKAYCTAIKGKYYLITDPLIVKVKNGAYLLREDCVELDRTIYGASVFIHKDYSVISTDGFVSRKEDLIKIMGGNGEFKYYNKHTNVVNSSKLVSVFDCFNDKTNPQEDRVTNVYAFATDLEANFTRIDFTNGGGPSNYVHNKMVPYVTECIENFIMPRILSKAEEVKKKLCQMYSDMDDEENNAKIFKVVNRNFPGKSEVYTPRKWDVPITSKTFVQTGGIKYSFGVEFETSQGLIQEKLEGFNMKAVGDRSIGAAEYVTGPMEGDNGIKSLQDDCDLLGSKTLVDDRCGLHVHVGGLREKDSPTFNKIFTKRSINLGALIEEELYSTLPPNRTPTLYHCHSIRRFAPVTDENFDENVGAFIFGEKEKWFDEKGIPITPFAFKRYRLNESRNQKSSLGTWAEGRYKWLNLIHSFTQSAHRTIEFRIFPGTTSFRKTYAYLMFCLAFTYVVDNCPGLIKPGVTIHDLLKAAFPKHLKLVEQVNNFYEKRKARFNRKNIYPKLTFLK